MKSHILGVWNNKNVIPTLLRGLQCVELKYGDYDLVGIATIRRGLIQRQQTIGNLKKLQSILRKKPIQGNFGIAYTRFKNHTRHEIRHIQLCGCDSFAIVLHGVIENSQELRKELLARGELLNRQTDDEIILHLLYRYWLKGVSPIEAMAATLTRLQGDFSIIALFGKPQGLLLAARQECSLAIGVSNNLIYVGSDISMLNMLSHQVMHIKEGSIAVLRSISTELDLTVT